MKLLVLISIVFLGTSALGNTSQVRHIYTCSNPRLVEGELKVSLSQDRKTAVVSLSGLVNYPTSVVSAGGPILTLDYNTGSGVERVIIAVDGGHELHAFNENSKKFVKIGNLTCRRPN